MWAVANEYRQACGAELGFIADVVPDATVRRVTHKTAGAHTCAYEITVADEAPASEAEPGGEGPDDVAV